MMPRPNVTPIFAALALGALLLAGCRQEPTPPPVAAPALTRPVARVTVADPGGRIVIPQAAVTERGGVPGVFVLSESGQARFRMVRPGRVVKEGVEILSGLAGGETLVLGDLTPVRDGSPIQMPAS